MAKEYSVYDWATNSWSKKTIEEMGKKQHYNFPMKKFKPEVPALEVHRVIHFLLFGKPEKVKHVLCCPDCKMPNLSGSYYANSVNCETCLKYFYNPEKMLEKHKVEDYLPIIRSLPLRNFGKLFLTQAERVKMIGEKPVTYNDLSVEDYKKLDEAALID